MNVANIVVFSCRWKIGNTLYYAIGQLKERALEDVRFCGEYTQGVHSQISLYDNNILEVHENYYLNSWMCKFGKLQDEKEKVTINWHEDSENSKYGFHLSVAMFNNRWIVIFVEGIFRRELKYMMGCMTQS